MIELCLCTLLKRSDFTEKAINLLVIKIESLKDNPQNIRNAVDVLINSFKPYFSLNLKEKEEIHRLFRQRIIKRKGFILQEGEVCKHFTFVVSGCFKMYAVDSDFKEHNLQFTVENNWITDIQSFYNEAPSKLFIEAVEPSVILQIEHKDLLYLYVNYHKFDRNFRIIAEQKYIAYQNRILENISSTAEERYTSFVASYPELINRLPNTQIASYLGITAEFLSKVRKNLLKK